MNDLLLGKNIVLVVEYSEDEKEKIKKIAEYITMIVDKKRLELEQSKDDIQTWKRNKKKVARK